MDPAAQPAAPLAPAGLKPWCIVLLASNDALAVWFICGANWKPQSDPELGTEPSGFSAMSTTPIDAGRAWPAVRAAEAAPGRWRDILLRVWRGISEDRILLVAGGVTLYLILAIFPGIAALIS